MLRERVVGDLGWSNICISDMSTLVREGWYTPSYPLRWLVTCMWWIESDSFACEFWTCLPNPVGQEFRPTIECCCRAPRKGVELQLGYEA